ncbi:hypothetical protein AB0B69_05930 [Micromonospora parva]|uniref:hypothetical protein n=1 Tax=Micromonospora parva TaxID=1464048 RepID=UPI0033F56898
MPMLFLDCEDVDTALRSLAAAAGVDEATLRAVLLAWDPDRSDWAEDEDPWVAVPRAILAELSVDIGGVKFDGAYYFHGTRVLRPHAFLQGGILPLGAILDRLWDDLYGLCDDQVTPAQWRALRQDLEGETGSTLRAEDGGWLYRLKFASEFHHGPYASLVRDLTLDPIDGQHDYLRSPETIEDITRCLGLGLQERFEARARSCIVKFRHSEVNRHTVEAALLFVLARIHGQSFGLGSVYGVDCRGAVRAADVMYVDEIDIAERGGQAPVKVYRHQAPRCASSEPLCSRSTDLVESDSPTARASP